MTATAKDVHRPNDDDGYNEVIDSYLYSCNYDWKIYGITDLSVSFSKW